MKSEYDIFISFKNTDDKTEEDTLDKEIAYKVYKYLTERQLNIFFSPVTLKALGRDSWSEEIDSALKQSKIFIAVGTQKEYMNSQWVYNERTKFFGLKLNDNSRAIYGYIASPMRLKDLPDDMQRIEVFQDKKSDALHSLYTYIHNHLARNRGLKVIGFNKNYFLIGILSLVGIFFFNSNNNVELIEIIEEEIEEKKEIIKEQKKKKKEDNKLLLVYKTEIELLRKELKDYPEKLKKIEEKAKEISKSKGLQSSVDFLHSQNINLNNYNNISLGLYIATSEIVKPTHDKFTNENFFYYYSAHGIWHGNGSLIHSGTNSTLKLRYNFMNYLSADMNSSYAIWRNHHFTYQKFFTFDKNLYSDNPNTTNQTLTTLK